MYTPEYTILLWRQQRKVPHLGITLSIICLCVLLSFCHTLHLLVPHWVCGTLVSLFSKFSQGIPSFWNPLLREGTPPHTNPVDIHPLLGPFGFEKKKSHRLNSGSTIVHVPKSVIMINYKPYCFGIVISYPYQLFNIFS